MSEKRYTFEELSARAKERAKDWWRSTAPNYLFENDAFEDIINAGKLLGITFRYRSDNERTPLINYTLSYGQGDGASFAGSWDFDNKPIIQDPASKMRKKMIGVETYYETFSIAIAENYPKDEKLAVIAKLFDACNGYRADVVISGHCNRSSCLLVHIQNKRDRTPNNDDYIMLTAKDYFNVGNDTDRVQEGIRIFSTWIYDTIKEYHEAVDTDEAISDSLIANQYTFNKDGYRMV